MTFQLTVISTGISFSRLSCGVEERALGSQANSPTPFLETKEEIHTFSYVQAQAELDSLDSAAPDSWRWKKKVFFLALASPIVESIFFIPAHFDKFQKIFASKGSREGYIDPSHFWQRRDLRSLTNFNGMEGEQLEVAKKIVEIFSADEQTDALALTFKNRFNQGFATFIWSKKQSFQ